MLTLLIFIIISNARLNAQTDNPVIRQTFKRERVSAPLPQNRVANPANDTPASVLQKRVERNQTKPVTGEAKTREPRQPRQKSIQ